ncbi:MAG: tetratricopeptide repeat protein [Verrucomicrobia bacterium]|nr:tetratricopeptide repeat protein [Verrucomicrobiota bacterium]
MMVVLALTVLQSGCKTHPEGKTDAEENSESVAAENASDDSLVEIVPVSDPFDTTQKRTEFKTLCAEEQRVNALARYAAGISQEINPSDSPEAAFVEFLQAANADPGNEALVIRVCHELISMGKADDAAKLLKLSCDRKDASANIYSWRALALAATGDSKSAIKVAKQAIKKSKETALAYQVLFGLYVDAGNTKEALNVLENAEREAQNSIPFLVDLAQLYLNNSDKIDPLGVDSVAAAKRQLATIEPLLEKTSDVRPEVIEGLGDIYARVNESQKAHDTYEKLLKQYPTNQQLREKRALTFLALGDVSRAELELRLLLRENPTNQRYCLLLGDIYQQRQQFKEAGDFYYYAATISRGNPEIYVLAAYMRLMEKIPQKALDALELARNAGGRSFRLEYLSAMAYMELGRYEDAIKCMLAAEAVDKESGGENLLPEFYLSLADLYDQIGKKEESLALVESVYEKNPDSVEVLNALGYTYADQGIHLEKALEMIQKAVEGSPDTAAYLDSLAWVLYKLGKSEEALPHQLKVFELSPELNPEAGAVYNDHLGDIYNALGKKNEAVEAWKKALEQYEQIKPISPRDKVLRDKTRQKLESAQ